MRRIATITGVLLAVCWTAAHADEGEPSAEEVVRALTARSRLLEDVFVQTPVSVYRDFLRDRAEGGPPGPPPPVDRIAEEGAYQIALDPNYVPTLRATVALCVLRPRGGQAQVLPADVAWEALTVNGKQQRLAVQKGWLCLPADQAGRFVVAGRAALPRLTAGGGAVSLAIAAAVRTAVAFDSPGAWEVTANGAPGRLVGQAGKGTHGVLAVAPRTDLAVQIAPWVALPPRPPRYELGGAVVWNFDAGRQQVAADVLVRIAGGGLTDRLELRLPADALQVAVTGPDVRDVQLARHGDSPEATGGGATGGGAATVFLRGSIGGQTRLDVRYELPMGAASVKRLDRIELADGHWAGGTLAVTNTAGGSELLPQAVEGLREILPAELPADARRILPGPAMLAYEITSRAFAASVDVVNLGEFSLRESIADLAHYQLLYRPDGSILCKADYEIRNRTRQFLRLDVPAGAKVLIARVNDKPQPLTAVPGERDAYLLPLIRSQASVKGLVSFPVQVLLMCRAEGLRRDGEISIPLPRIDLPVAYGWAEAAVPEALTVRQWGGPMQQVDKYSSETAVASLTYGRGEMAEGYKAKDRPTVEDHATASPAVAHEPGTVKTPPKSRVGHLGLGLLAPAAGGAAAPTEQYQPPAPALLPPLTVVPAPSPGKPARQQSKGEINAPIQVLSNSLPDILENVPTTQPAPRPAPQPVAQSLAGATIFGSLTADKLRPVGGAGALTISGGSLTVASGGTLSLGGQVMLSRNYYRAGRDYYEKGNLAEASESLKKAAELAPKTPEAANAERLLANIDALQGRSSGANREEKALAKQVKTEQSAMNVDLEQKQQELIEKGKSSLTLGNLASAQTSFQAARSLGEQLVAQGADEKEQSVRLREANEKLADLLGRQKQQAGQLRQRFTQLKQRGDVEAALRVGKAIQALDTDGEAISDARLDARKSGELRTELEDLAVKAVQQRNQPKEGRRGDAEEDRRGDAETRGRGEGKTGFATAPVDQVAKLPAVKTVEPPAGATPHGREQGGPVIVQPAAAAARAPVGVKNGSASFLNGIQTGIGSNIGADVSGGPAIQSAPFFLPPTTRPAKADTKQPGLGTWSSEDTDLLDSPPAPAPDTTVAPGESDMTKVLAAKESAEARLREYLGDSAASLAKPPTAASLRHAESAARDAFDTVRASKGLYSEKEYADRITEARGQLSAVKEAQEGKAAQPGAAQLNGPDSSGPATSDNAWGLARGDGTRPTARPAGTEDGLAFRPDAARSIAAHRKDMEDAVAAARADPSNKELTKRVAYLQGKLRPPDSREIELETITENPADGPAGRDAGRAGAAPAEGPGILSRLEHQKVTAKQEAEVAMDKAVRGKLDNKGTIRRLYDVRDLLVAGPGVQGSQAGEQREKLTAEVTKLAKDALGTEGVQIVNGQLVVSAPREGQTAVAELVDRLRSVRGPQVEVAGNIRQQQAEGLVNQPDSGAQAVADDSLSMTDLGRSKGGLWQAAVNFDSFRTDTNGDRQQVVSRPEFQDFLRRNYAWRTAAGNDGGWGYIGNGVAAGNGRLWGKVTAPVDPAAELGRKLTSNLGQKVAVNSLNIAADPATAARLGVRFEAGKNSVNFAVVDEAQLRTLRELEATNAASGAANTAAANPRLQETIVGTDALLAGGQVANVAFAGERGNTLDVADNPIALPHDKYLLLANGGILTAVKAGAMQHWTETAVRPEFAEVPQDIAVPMVGRVIKFEKTLIKPTDNLTIRATYTWKE